MSLIVRMRCIRLRARAIVLIALAAIAASCGRDRTQQEPQMTAAEAEAFIQKWKLPSTVGHTAIDFSLPVIGSDALSGDSVHLEKLNGQVVVLNFWSTWCGPCIREHDDLNTIAEE